MSAWATPHQPLALVKTRPTVGDCWIVQRGKRWWHESKSGERRFWTRMLVDARIYSTREAAESAAAGLPGANAVPFIKREGVMTDDNC